MSRFTSKLINKIDSLRQVLFYAILAIFLGFTISLSLYTPSFEGPDENSHYLWTLDTLHGNIHAGEIDVMPVYYSINAFFLNYIPHPENIEIQLNPSYSEHDPNKFNHFQEEKFPFSGTAFPVHLLRIFSIICGAVTVIFTYKIAQIVVSTNKWLPLFSTAFVAFIPKFQFQSAVMNPDALVWALSTISIYLLLRFVNQQNKIKYLILLGIFAGFAYLSKPNGIVLIPVVLITFTYLLFSKQINRKQFLKYFTIFFIIFLVSGGAYEFYRNEIVFTEPFIKDYTLTIKAGVDCMTLSYFNITMLYYPLGYIGWNMIPPTYEAVFTLSVIITVAIAGLFLVSVKKISLSNVKFEGKYAAPLYASPVFIILGLFWWLSHICGADIRYTFPVISSFGILTGIGLYAFVDKPRLKWLLVLPIIFLITQDAHIITQINIQYLHGFK